VMLMELHVNNPSLLPVTLNSGMRMYYTTSKLRPVEAGIIEAGTSIDQFLQVPPGITTTMYGFCYSACTEALAGNVTVFAVFLHMHTAGVAITTTQIRNGVDLGPLLSNDQYDFNLQQFVVLDGGSTLMPGDELLTTCTYSGANRTKMTVGGLSTTDEMCLSYLLVYPRPLQLQSCLSSYDAAFALELTKRNAYGAGVTFEKGEQTFDGVFARATNYSNFNAAWAAALNETSLIQPACFDAASKYGVVGDTYTLRMGKINITQPYVAPSGTCLTANNGTSTATATATATATPAATATATATSPGITNGTHRGVSVAASMSVSVTTLLVAAAAAAATAMAL